jgi:cold shock CspA family protein
MIMVTNSDGKTPNPNVNIYGPLGRLNASLPRLCLPYNKKKGIVHIARLQNTRDIVAHLSKIDINMLQIQTAKTANINVNTYTAPERLNASLPRLCLPYNNKKAILHIARLENTTDILAHLSKIHNNALEIHTAKTPNLNVNIY